MGPLWPIHSRVARSFRHVRTFEILTAAFALPNLVERRTSHSANNIPNTYSAGLSMQALGRPFAVIPRFFWVFLAFVVYTVAGVAGREHFSAILSNFLSILSYWTAFFIVIVAEEHFIFRRKNGPLGGYNLDDYDTPSK
jgi:purine-cytosine permease-like protein